MIKAIVDFFGGDTEEVVFVNGENVSAYDAYQSFESFLKDSHSGVVVDTVVSC